MTINPDVNATRSITVAGVNRLNSFIGQLEQCALTFSLGIIYKDIIHYFLATGVLYPNEQLESFGVGKCAATVLLVGCFFQFSKLRKIMTYGPVPFHE